MYNTIMVNLLLMGSIIMIMIVLISLSSNVAYFHSKNHRAAAQFNTNSTTNATIAPSQPSSRTITGKFLTYENPMSGIKIQYPSEWTVSQAGLRDHTNIVAFYTPLDNFSDTIPENVLLSLNHYSQNVTLNDYGKLINATVNQPGFQSLESKSIRLADGSPAHMIVFTPPSPALGGGIGNLQLKPQIMLVWTVKGNNVYTIAYNAATTSYSKYLPIVQKMISSFAALK